ncbi:ATP-binding protein [Ideonella sp.]|uniref:sensor histidine kinase n=1 Tax=Ideonella sp. TaxID=1929293 RepID=UPI0035B29CB2
MSDEFDNGVDYYMRLLVDRVPSMLAYWDRNLRCRFANRAYERWFGADPDRLIGTSIRDLLGPDLFAQNEPYMRAALAGESQVFERIVPGPGGVQRHSLAEYIPDVVDGVVRGFLVQVTEVTQLKETQAALRREQLLRNQIEEHAAALDALLHERTEMLDVLAHEVRQPLNNASAALQSAQGALRTMGEGFAAEQLVRAQTVLGQVLGSIDNTLAVAALLARPEPILRTDTDVDTLIAVSIADMPDAERHRIQVRRNTSTRTAFMDMSLARLALRNVLSNALKFSPPGSPVKVLIDDSDDPLGLVIEVSDSGPGIRPELLPTLFSRGARGSDSNTGNGLGLYIVRQVMALHGGTVEVARTGPEGTTLRLVIDQTGAG